MLPIAAPAAAQQNPVSPVLFVDLERLSKETMFGERVERQAEERKREYIAEGKRIGNELAAEEEALTALRAEIDPTEFRALAEAFDEKATRLRAIQDAQIPRLTRQYEREKARARRAFIPIIGRIMQERGAQVVLDRRSVFISAKTVDITSEVIGLSNQLLGDGASFEVPVPKPRPAVPGSVGQQAAPEGAEEDPEAAGDTVPADN